MSSGAEQGLLGLVFSPDGSHLYVNYTDTAGDTHIVEYAMSGAVANTGTRRELLFVDQPFANHNGGNLLFGPDGLLWIGLGDGGSGGDPSNNAQNPGTPLGKILRMDAATGQYSMWALGLRNPWRFSFDSANGDLYIGDVGQSAWEEIDRQPADSRGGENFGWNQMEGDHCYRPGCNPSLYVKPIAEYGHDQGCAVIGGYVYRGSRQPSLRGVYVFSDNCSGILWTLQVDAGRLAPKVVLDSGSSISSFGVGDDGEIYAADLRGNISHVVLG